MNDLIDDLKLEPLNQPMTDGDIIDMINCDIDMEKWSEKDRKFGREIEVFPEWRSQMDKIVWDYRWSGWHCLWMTHGEREYLLFANPDLRRFNDGKDE